MKHPQTRSERRSTRELYIRRRRKERIITNQRAYARNEIPHEGNGYLYDTYIKYLNFIQLSEDDKKILEVEAALDGIEFIAPTWTTTCWSRYAKWNGTCSCGSCRNQGQKKEKRKRRRELDQAVIDNLESYDFHGRSIKEQLLNYLETKKRQKEQFKIDQVEAALDGEVCWKWLSDYEYWCEDDLYESHISVKSI